MSVDYMNLYPDIPGYHSHPENVTHGVNACYQLLNIQV